MSGSRLVFLGLCLALLLMEEIPGSSVLRALFIVPMMIPAVVVGLNFKLIFDTFGPLNGFLQAIGLDRIPWLSDPTWARAAVVLSDVWQWTPFMFIILLAGLQSIPDELYDSAKVDGAVGWTLFRHITWPMLVPSATVAIAFRVMDVLRIFDIPFMMTNGGPSFATEVLSLYIFRTSFRFGSMSYAATLAFLMLIILSVTINFITKATKLSTRLEWD